MRVSRVDRMSGPLTVVRVQDKATETPQEFLRCAGRLSRTGVQLYTAPDGSTIREYRPPSEVFAKPAMDSLVSAPVVIGHPATVSPSNWKALAVGHVINPQPEDNKYVRADVIVADAEAIRRVNLSDEDASALREVSLGYDVDLEWKSGTSPDGEAYDAIQRGIVVNHVGLGPKNWGRAGNAVALQVDNWADRLDAELRAIRDDTRALRARVSQALQAQEQERERVNYLASERLRARDDHEAAERRRAEEDYRRGRPIETRYRFN